LLVYCQSINASPKRSFKLTHAGKPLICIVTAVKPTRAAQIGAFELQNYLEKISGAKIPTISDSSKIKGSPIFVGYSVAAVKAGFPKITWKPLEYAVLFRSDAIFLAGDDKDDYGKVKYQLESDLLQSGDLPELVDPQGTMHAVYNFLEKFCGVRWWNATEFGTEIPKNPSLIVMGQDIRRQPDFPYRNLITGKSGWRVIDSQNFWNGIKEPEQYENFMRTAYPEAYKEQRAIDARFPERKRKKTGRYLFNNRHLWKLTNDRNYLWLLRNRFGGSENFSCCHSINPYYFRFWEKSTKPHYAKYFVGKKVDWFAKGVEGKPHQLCYTNEEVVQQVAQDARDFFDGKLDNTMIHEFRAVPGSDYFPVVPNDGWGFCKCPECEKLKKQNYYSPYFANGKLSDYWFSFVNRVARELKKTHPNKYIATLSYGSYAELPSFPIENNVAVQFCHGCRTPYDVKNNAHETKLLKEWAEKYPNSRLFLWLYYTFPRERAGNGNRWHVFPGMFTHHIAPLFRKYKELGYHGPFFNGWAEDIDAYLTLKMLENCELDVDATLNEFFASYYGAAAPPMQKLYTMLERLYSDPANYPALRAGDLVGHQTQKIAWGLLGNHINMNKMRQLLNEAKKLANNDKVNARLDIFDKGIFSYMEDGRKKYEKSIQSRCNLRECRVPWIAEQISDGDPAKVNWRDAFALVNWYTPYGEPTWHMPFVRVAHDGKNLYLRYDEKKSNVFPTQSGEPATTRFVVLLAKSPQDTLFELEVAANKKCEAKVHQPDGSFVPWQVKPEIQTRFKKDLSWTVELTLPLASMKLKPGERIYFNAARIGATDDDIAVWIPTGDFLRNRKQMGWLLLDDTKMSSTVPLSTVELAELDKKDLVGRWDFNGEGKVVKDVSGNGFDGVFNEVDDGSAKRVPGLRGKGLNCSGTHFCGITVPYSPKFDLTDGPLTVELWLKTNPNIIAQGNPTVVCRMDRDKAKDVFALHLRRELARVAFQLTDTKGKVIGVNTQDFPREANSIAPMTWTHLVGTWDGEKIRIYLNGRLHGKEMSFAGPLQKSDAALYIGSPPRGERFRGIIDDVSIYNRTFTAEEARGRYLQGCAELKSK
jgi:hypothetical protein